MKIVQMYSFFMYWRHKMSVFWVSRKQKPFFSCIFATFVLTLQRFSERDSTRDVVQLVVYLVWDQVVARSSRVIPTNMKRNFKPGTMIYPLPAVMVSCGDTPEEYNIITVAWTGTLCTNPPMCYISVRPERYSHDII